MSSQPPSHHDTHGTHPDHKELARLHTIGWFLGRDLRTRHAHAHARMEAFLTGLAQAISDERGDDDG